MAKFGGTLLKFGGTQKCRGTVVENHWPKTNARNTNISLSRDIYWICLAWNRYVRVNVVLIIFRSKVRCKIFGMGPRVLWSSKPCPAYLAPLLPTLKTIEKYYPKYLIFFFPKYGITLNCTFLYVYLTHTDTNLSKR